MPRAERWGRLQRKTAGRWTSWIFSYYHESSTVSRTHHAKSTIDELSDEASSCDRE